MILIVKYAGIGDIVMSLPAYYYLSERHGKDHIYWCVDSTLKEFLTLFVPSQNIISYNFKELHGGLFKKIALVLKVNLLIASPRWKKIYFFHADLRYKLMQLFGFNRIVSYSHKISERQTFIHGRYSGINFFSMASKIDGPELIKFNQYFDQAKSTIFNLLSNNKRASLKDIVPVTPYIVICPSITGNIGDQSAKLRRLPFHKWNEIIEHINKLGYKVLVLGSNDERSLVKLNLHNVVNLCGMTTFHDIFSILDKAKYVITTDNGLMHCAYLTKTKCIAFFGPTSPAERIPPNTDVQVVIKEKMHCSPCHDGRLTHECASHECLEMIDLKNCLSLIK
jgi:ADP-heptose:LPS heptosyltransferase